MMAVLPRQQGVSGAGDYAVTQRGAGANMSVDVAAGDAWINGTTNSRQGLYHVFNNGTVNVAPIAAANGTKPRVDQIILVANDSSVIGTTDIAELVVVEGTATTGAQINNTTGANYRAGAKTDVEIRASTSPHGGPNFIRLADVLVPAAATKVENTNIIDRRPWANGVVAYAKDESGTKTGTSTAVEIPNCKLRLECTGAPLHVIIKANAAIKSPYEGQFHANLWVDGTNTLNVAQTSSYRSTGDASANLNGNGIYVPSAGTHIFVPKIHIEDSHEGQVFASAESPILMLIRELVSSANNGVA
jgi:hypothetical protein